MAVVLALDTRKLGNEQGVLLADVDARTVQPPTAVVALDQEGRGAWVDVVAAYDAVHRCTGGTWTQEAVD